MLGRAAFGLALRLQVRVPQHRLAIARRDVERRPRRDLLLLDDVADAPPAARPRVGERGLRLVFGEAARVALQLIGVEEERRGEPRAGRFGQHAGDVVERRDPVEAEVAPARVDRRVHDALAVRLFFLVGDVGAVPAHLAPYERVGAGTDRLGVRRHVDVSRRRHPSGGGRRTPAESSRGTAPSRRTATRPCSSGTRRGCYRGRRTCDRGTEVRALVLRADVFLVPVGDHDLPVGVETGNHDADHVVENAFACRRPCARPARR